MEIVGKNLIYTLEILVYRVTIPLKFLVDDHFPIFEGHNWFCALTIFGPMWTSSNKKVDLSHNNEDFDLEM